jgi:hypothetical protein
MQHLPVRRADLDQPLYADGAELARGDRAHPPKRFHRQLLQKCLHAFRRNDRQAIGLAIARGDLRQELVGRHAGRCGEPGGMADLRFQALRDLAAERLAPCVLRDIEVRLVER